MKRRRNMKRSITLLILFISALVFTSCCSVSRLECPSSCKHDSIAAKPLSGIDEPQKGRTFWKARWEAKINQAKADGEKCRIVFLGDSITHFWESKGKEVYDETFPKYHTLNLGFSGDRTQHTLWIAQESGVFNIVHPDLIVIMIGTNNIGWKESSPAEAACGIRQILKALRKNAPQAKILLFDVFPCGEKPTDAHRLLVNEINAQLPAMADGKHIFHLSINDKLMDADGTIQKSMMADFLHPGKPGYIIWRDAIQPYIDRFVAP